MTAPRSIIVAGIDPASTTGLVALAIDPVYPIDRLRWRWVDCCVVSKSHRENVSRARNALALFDRARAQLVAWGVKIVAIERPADAAVSWRGAQGQEGKQNVGTAFAIGEAYGMLAAAAHDAGARVFDYPVTSRKANPAKHKKERIGWMPMERGGARGQLWHVAPRHKTLDDLHRFSIELRTRPHNGVLPPERSKILDENCLMALGVLRFHLSRQTAL